MTCNLPRTAVAALTLTLAAVSPAPAGDLSGRIELSYTGASTGAGSLAAALAQSDFTGQTGDVRLMWSDRSGDWDTEIHYRFHIDTGDAARVGAAIAAAQPAAAPQTFFDLSETATAGGATVTHSIDRLSVAYSAPEFVLRVGRQALTWGAGMAFHPSDLVAPFSPAATDTEFKPGADMVYLQFLMNDGSDIELIAVPRRARAGGPLDPGESTLALRYRTFLGALGANAIVARDHGDLTAALGLSGSLADAAWNAEIVPTRLASGEMRTSALANISTGVTLFGRSALVFAEYFHNGFGVGRTGPALDTLPAELSDRLARGQVFTTSRDYLALGISLEITPLVSLGANSIVNLDDRSTLTAAELNWSLSDNSNLLFGVQLPTGGRGTEFGGLPLSGAGAPYLGPEKSAYVRFRQYF